MIGQALAAQEMTQNSRSTAGKAQACGETFARSPTNSVTQQAQNTGRTLRLSRTRIDYPRQSLGEDGPAAFRVPTLPSTDRERDPHRSALDRQVPQPPPIRAMSRRRDDLTSWALGTALCSGIRTPMELLRAAGGSLVACGRGLCKRPRRVYVAEAVC
jgi:hypothetical protein